MPDTVMAYWVERDSGTLRSVMMGPHDLLGGTFESEVRIKHARDAEEVLIVPLGHLGADWAKAAVRRLKGRGEEIRAAKGA